MAKKTSKRKVVGLVAEDTGTRDYYTTKSFKNSPERIKLKKYNPNTQKMSTYVETKKNLGRNEV